MVIVEVYWRWSSFISTKYCMKWCLTFLCLFWSVSLGFIVILIHDWLPQYSFICDKLITSSSFKILLSHKPSFANSATTTYAALMDDCATVVCFFVLHDIDPPENHSQNRAGWVHILPIGICLSLKRWGEPPFKRGRIPRLESPISYCWDTSSTSAGSAEEAEDRVGWDRSDRPVLRREPMTRGKIFH